MKVKEIINALKDYDPEERVMIAYWTKDEVQEWFSDDEVITNELWNKAVDEFDTYSLQDTADDITSFIADEFENAGI